jgi:hypothetical protein
MTAFRIDEDVNIDGTSLRCNLTTTGRQLKAAFGMPLDGDGYKVTQEWHFVDESDTSRVFTIYDWKTVGLGLTDTMEWVFNVGGRSDATDFITWAKAKLDEASQPPVPKGETTEAAAKKAPRKKAAPKKAAPKPAAKKATKASEGSKAGKKAPAKKK